MLFQEGEMTPKVHAFYLVSFVLNAQLKYVIGIYSERIIDD